MGIRCEWVLVNNEQAKERVRHLREAESDRVLATGTPGELLAPLVEGINHRYAKTKALIREFWDNSFLRNLGQIDWLQYQLIPIPILIASVLSLTNGAAKST